MPLDIIQQEIYTGSIKIRAHSCDSPPSFSVCPISDNTLHPLNRFSDAPRAQAWIRDRGTLSELLWSRLVNTLHRIGCKHIPYYFAFPIAIGSALQTHT